MMLDRPTYTENETNVCKRPKAHGWLEDEYFIPFRSLWPDLSNLADGTLSM
jgi:hypothetical protein